jgi:hypothetical protein
MSGKMEFTIVKSFEALVNANLKIIVSKPTQSQSSQTILLVNTLQVNKTIP